MLRPTLRSLINTVALADRTKQEDQDQTAFTAVAEAFSKQFVAPRDLVKIAAGCVAAALIVLRKL